MTIQKGDKFIVVTSVFPVGHYRLKKDDEFVVQDVDRSSVLKVFVLIKNRYFDNALWVSQENLETHCNKI